LGRPMWLLSATSSNKEVIPQPFSKSLCSKSGVGQLAEASAILKQECAYRSSARGQAATGLTGGA
jgi:hypothetical protein